MSDAQIFINIIWILVIFVLAFFFILAEFALVSTRPSQIEDALENNQGNVKKLKRAKYMLEHLNEYLSTTQVGTTVTSLVLGWIGEDTLQAFFDHVLDISLKSSPTIHAISSVIALLLLTYLQVVITEIVPKNISIDLPLKMLLLTVTPLKAFHTIAYPFVWLLNVSATGIVKMIGMKPADSESEAFTQSEILRLSQASVSNGELDKNDLIYMRRAFDLNDKSAKDIMIDRTRLYVVDITDTVNDVIKDYLQQGFSRFPVVADNDKDKILGYVYVYDLVRQKQVDGSIPISRMLRSMVTVPESMPIHSVLNQMIAKQTPIVVVVDEYGGTSGIVTDKDIYEELFGTVKDEVDNVSEEYITKNKDGSYNVSGQTTLYDFERYFKVEISEFKESDIVTLSGYFIDKYPNLHLNSVIHLDQFTLKVIDFEHSYVNKFQVTIDKTAPVENNNELKSLTD
ncbi:hemolysin family protein [Bombilactobacillus thymidiniphilus]|uniref:Hemolysin family protein n=1 Tax=Bombilactobacillus thymidiniphilus TaxID=2923363 RepID=A0ABY4PBD5_9LACO|nr:hemolysin family protein [Bombilactobacillus thymidiniphilus]UQS83075.1 hemolysin family protein [Bombilactobacillus thymidiniphilus]